MLETKLKTTTCGSTKKTEVAHLIELMMEEVLVQLHEVILKINLKIGGNRKDRMVH